LCGCFSRTISRQCIPVSIDQKDFRLWRLQVTLCAAKLGARLELYNEKGRHGGICLLQFITRRSTNLGIGAEYASRKCARIIPKADPESSKSVMGQTEIAGTPVFPTVQRLHGRDLQNAVKMTFAKGAALETFRSMSIPASTECQRSIDIHEATRSMIGLEDRIRAFQLRSTRPRPRGKPKPRRASKQAGRLAA